MMSSQSLHTVVDPVFRSKMPLLVGNMASAGLSKPQSMAGFLGKEMLQYGGAYFTYDPRGKDGAGFSPAWSNAKASLLDGRSAVSHLSGMEGQNHIVYRQDGCSSEEGHSLSSSLHHVPEKQGFTLYTKRPGGNSPTAAAAASVAVRKQKSGGENSSPTSEGSVYLAIPKPVYVHHPCCNELGCVIGHRYSVAQHGSPTIANAVYEHDGMQTDTHYTERPPIPRKERGLHVESRGEQLKRMHLETYSPSRVRTLPARFDPNYGGYPCNSTQFGPPSEQSQRLQTSPRGYPGLYPSLPTYEHMTSELYQEHSPMSKYGQLAQHPMFYYSQENVEVENRTQCKQREDVPVILKHTTPREHYIVPQSLHGEIPLSLQSPETLTNHVLMQGFDYPCYAVPRFNLNASQLKPHLKRQQVPTSFHSNRLNISPSSQYMKHPATKPSANPYDQLRTGSPFLCVDPTSPTRHIKQPRLSPSSIQINRFFPPLSGLHIERPIFPPAGLSMDRILNYSSCEAEVMCQKKPKSLPVSPAPWLPQSPHHGSDRVHTAAPNSANVQKIIYSPAAAAAAPGNKHNNPGSSSGTSFLRECLKRSLSHSSSPIKIKEEDRELCEVELVKKCRLEKENAENKKDSPPMPVIDNVFSLAPYQAYLQAPGVLFPGRAPQRTVQSAEPHEIKTKQDIKAQRPNRDEQQSVLCLAPKKTCADAPPAVEVFEPLNIKVEKVDTDTDGPAESPESHCSKVTIKKEPEEETSSCSSEHVLVIKKVEPDEFETKPPSENEDDVSQESKPDEASVEMKSPSQDDASTPQEQVTPLQPEPITPPQPPENKPNFKNIPPQCLKLSTYNLIPCNPKHLYPAPAPERPIAPLITEFKPQPEVKPPVRKHFFELHHSLCKIVSNFVSASPEQDLRTWLSQLELTEPTSPSSKVPKVSRLLGAKAREAWLSEDIKSALNKVLGRLREYRAQERCPFPHVIRTGAVFLPMLVVKELLFSTVQGGFIDQVLQEHRVELRPTTLSEEKLLIQFHKRACSSKLRRLMSLKHLPDIYADAVNLLYYTCVYKHLGLDMDDPVDRDKDEGCDGSISSKTPVFSDATTPGSSPPEPHPQRHPKEPEKRPDLNCTRRKSRIKTISRRMFLDDTLSEEEEVGDTDETVSGGSAFGEKTWCDETENRGSDFVVTGQDSSLTPLSMTSENSWMCPLTSDKLPPSPGDTEAEKYSLQPVKSCSGVILKLKRMFSKGLNRKKARYKAISDSETFADPSPGEGDVCRKRDIHRKTTKVPHRWQRTGSFSHTLRPLSSSSKRNHRSLLKIKYCPYLSACHSAEHRSRWVLRSAVQKAQRAMRFYPDLVGKRIRHLYEEDDKSEVWYRGEVLRIHEANSNPLKTIFEVRYESEPEWKYYLELMMDYRKGWLKIED